MVHMVGTGNFIGFRGVSSAPQHFERVPGGTEPARYFERLVPEGSERTPVLREAGMEGYRLYPGISRGRYRAYSGFREARTGGYRVHPGVSRSRYREVPKPYRGTGTGPVPVVTVIAVPYHFNLRNTSSNDCWIPI